RASSTSRHRRRASKRSRGCCTSSPSCRCSCAVYAAAVPARRLTSQPPSLSEARTFSSMRNAILATLLVATPVLVGCTSNTHGSGTAAGDDRVVDVTSTDDSCDMSSTRVPSGTLTFNVTNAGSKVTEFYLLGSDGLRIVGEVENIGPQLSRQLVLSAPDG